MAIDAMAVASWASGACRIEVSGSIRDQLVEQLELLANLLCKYPIDHGTATLSAHGSLVPSVSVRGSRCENQVSQRGAVG